MNIAFASSMDSVPWGGSEVLWFETAELLARAGHSLFLATAVWPDLPPPLVKARTQWNPNHCFDYSNRSKPFVRRVASRLMGLSGERFRRRWLRDHQPSIFCLSNGNAFQGLAWMEAAIAESVPFVTIAQAHADFLFPDDITALRLIRAFSQARLNYFVSVANLDLVETQLGIRIPNAHVIANHSRYLPTDAPLPWFDSDDQIYRLACVGRLHPSSKGQDLLFHVLADPLWRDRKLEVSLYGEGDQELCLRRLASMLGLDDRVRFMGHCNNPMQIWTTHHALILPSRYEGLPLVFMEAMLAGRPVITTAVAGASELIDHGITGYLADSPTIRHLHTCLDEAWASRAQWHEVGTAAHFKAKSRARIAPAERLADELVQLAQEK